MQLVVGCAESVLGAVAAVLALFACRSTISTPPAAARTPNTSRQAIVGALHVRHVRTLGYNMSICLEVRQRQHCPASKRASPFVGGME